MEIFSALVALCEFASVVTSEFASERPGTQSFDVAVDLRLNKRWSKQMCHRSFETPLRSLWRQCNDQNTTSDWTIVPWQMHKDAENVDVEYFC